jgi:serine/threonine protein kinase
MAVTLANDSIFARDYKIIRPLNEGGMGAVYVVEQISTGSQRALKLMHPQFVQDARSRQRFEQEARVGARIESEHVVQVLAAGVDDATGYPYIVMELLKGEDLSVALQRRGAIAAAEVNQIFGQLCHALAAAHAAGVVHRDLKPENIFLAASHREGSSFTVKVLDFGIAKVVAEAKNSSTAAIGTPLWMAPEQTAAHSTVGPPTDVWALGLIAFRMLTGRIYWVAANDEAATTAALMREILFEPVIPAAERASQLGVSHLLPPGFDGWFVRCVNREMNQRYPNAAEARAALAQLLGGFTPAPGPTHGTQIIGAPAGYTPAPPAGAQAASHTIPGQPYMAPSIAQQAPTPPQTTPQAPMGMAPPMQP